VISYALRNSGIKHDHLANVAVVCLGDFYSSIIFWGASEADALEESVAMGINILQRLEEDSEDDVIDRAWEFIKGWITSKRLAFYDDALIRIGKIEGKRYYVIKQHLNNALEEQGFSASKSVRGFIDRGYFEPYMRSDGKKCSSQQKRFHGEGRVDVFTISPKVFAAPLFNSEEPVVWPDEADAGRES
jgi:hypothetical protein